MLQYRVQYRTKGKLIYMYTVCVYLHKHIHIVHVHIHTHTHTLFNFLASPTSFFFQTHVTKRTADVSVTVMFFSWRLQCRLVLLPLSAGTSACWSWSTVAGRSFRSIRPSWRAWPSTTSWPSSADWRRSCTLRGWCKETSPARWDLLRSSNRN